MNSNAFILLVATAFAGLFIIIVLADENRLVRRAACEQRGGVVVKTPEGSVCIKAEVLK